MLGGYVDGVKSAKVTRFDLKENSFHCLADMNVAREKFSALVTEDRLYAIGDHPVIEWLKLSGTEEEKKWQKGTRSV